LLIIIGHTISFIWKVMFVGDFEALSGVHLPATFDHEHYSELAISDSFQSVKPDFVYGEYSLKPKDYKSMFHPLFVSRVLLTLVSYILGLWMLYVGRKFLTNIIDKQFFIKVNVKRLLMLGHLSFAGLLIALLDIVILKIYLFHNQSLPG